MWRFAVLLTAAASIVACATSGAPPFIQKIEAGPRYSLTDAEMNAIKARIIPTLKDPDSARFSPPVASQQPDGSVLVCGSVNAKNSFGGYTGMKPYYAWLKNGQIEKITMSEELERLRISLHPCPS